MEKNKKIWIGAGCSIAILGIAATICHISRNYGRIWESDGWNYRRFHSEHWYSISDF